jgi:PAS domain S-box-containing protein
MEWHAPAVVSGLTALALAIAATVLLLLHVRREAQRAGHAAGLAAGERRLHTVFAALADGVVVFGPDGAVADLSPAAERMMGVPRASALGRRYSPSLWRCCREDGTVVEADDFPSAVTLASGERQRDTVVRLTRRDGTEAWLSINTEPLAGEADAPAGVVMSLSDVTARMRAVAALRASEKFQRDLIASTEEQLAQAQKLEAIGQLTGGLAHDYNNMLGIVIGSLDLLAPGVSGENRELIDAATAAAQRGVEVTRSLLGVARRQKLAPKETDVNELLLEMAPLLRQTAGKRVKVAVDARALEAVVHLDAGGFNNAILNLVINARDAMPAGGELRIATRVAVLDAAAAPGLKPGRYTRVTVGDTGGGMSPEVAARAFDPFYTTKGHGEGTGLGLAMVDGFARRSGGLATIASAPGRGTTVTLLLPCAVRTIPGGPGTKPDEPPPLPTGKERLLLVDDETDLLRVNRVALQALGYDVTAECAPGKALERLKAERYDMLLSDVIMPGDLDGVALADAARELHPSLPVLLVSGYADALISRIQGRYSLLDKPFRREQLARAVREILDRRDAAPGGQGAPAPAAA